MSRGQDSIVSVENQEPGTLEWLPTNIRYTPDGKRGETIGDDLVTWLDSGRGKQVEAWVSHSSIEAGETLTLYANTSPVSDIKLDLYRMGYYGGLGARKVASVDPVSGIEQAEPEPGEMRLMECDWEPSLEIEISADWPSGIYLGKLTRLDNGVESYVIFVIRDAREADLIVQTSDITWQAYNRWPNIYSLYSNGDDNLTAHYGADVAVSYDRPYLSTTYFNSPLPGTGEFFVFEFPFVYWLESHGYDATYCANVDTHRGTAGLDRAKAFLSVGHDEYVTLAMYENLTSARDAGLSLGFFCGNSYCFNVGARPSKKGIPDRIYSRIDAFGPDRSPESGYEPQPQEAAFRDYYGFPLESPDEGLLMGARNHWPVEGVGDWVCSMPDHWIFEGTGMVEGDAIPNLVGHEWHGNPADQITGLDVVARGRTWEDGLGDGEYSATLYPGPDGNIVFNAATCWWGTGLSHPPGFERPTWHSMPSALPDDRVQTITRNILDRMISPRSRDDRS